MNRSVEVRGAIAVTLLSLAGCAAERLPISAEDSVVVTERYVLYGWGAYVFRLKDGTRCVLAPQAGIDCEWLRHE